MLAGGSRERFLTSLQPSAIHVVLDQGNALRPNRIVGRFREPPARERLTNATVVCALSSGHGERLKAAPLHGCRPLRPRKRGSAPNRAFSEREHHSRIHVRRIVRLQILVDPLVIEVSAQRFSRLGLHSGKRQKFHAHTSSQPDLAIGKDGVVKLRPADRGAGRIGHPEISAVKLTVCK